MGDEEYNKKLENLQQYIPFLENMIAQLRDPTKKNREPQLAKLESLHSMITDKKKKLKLETLVKCEEVILKLYDKVHPFGVSPITPASPSPPRDLSGLVTKPVVIPTEKIKTPKIEDLTISMSPTSTKPIIDVYSIAADSLNKKEDTKNILDQLNDNKLDMSKPPIITLEDLKSLENVAAAHQCDPNNMSLGELTDLRLQLQKQLDVAVGENPILKSKDHSTINTTVRNSLCLTKKNISPDKKYNPKTDAVKPSNANTDSNNKPSTSGSNNEIKIEEKKKDDNNSNKSQQKKVPKVIKEAGIFGSMLSSIDNQILDKSKDATKKEERRNSSSGNSAKIEKRSSIDGHRSSSTEKRTKDKLTIKSDDKKSINPDRKPKEEKDLERKSHKSHRDETKEKDKDKDGERKSRKDKKSSDLREIIERRRNNSSSRDSSSSSKHRQPDKLDSPIKIKTDPRLNRDDKRSKDSKSSSSEKSNEPTYQRLADKYKRKPKSSSSQAIEEKPPVAPINQPKLPFNETKKLWGLAPVTSPEPSPQADVSMIMPKAAPSPAIIPNNILQYPSTLNSLNNLIPINQNVMGQYVMAQPMPTYEFNQVDQYNQANQFYNVPSTPIATFPTPQYCQTPMQPTFASPPSTPQQIVQLPTQQQQQQKIPPQPGVPFNPFEPLDTAKSNQSSNNRQSYSNSTIVSPKYDSNWGAKPAAPPVRDPRTARNFPPVPKNSTAPPNKNAQKQWTDPSESRIYRSYQEFREAKERDRKSRDPRMGRYGANKTQDRVTTPQTPADTFGSPLDSLYNSDNVNSKGYGNTKNFNNYKSFNKKSYNKNKNNNYNDNNKRNDSTDNWDDDLNDSSVNNIKITNVVTVNAEENWDDDLNDNNTINTNTNNYVDQPKNDEENWDDEIKQYESTQQYGDQNNTDVAVTTTSTTSSIAPSMNRQSNYMKMNEEVSSSNDHQQEKNATNDKGILEEFFAGLVNRDKKVKKKTSALLSFFSTLSDISENQLKMITKILKKKDDNVSTEDDDEEVEEEEEEDDNNDNILQEEEEEEEDDDDDDIQEQLSLLMRKKKKTLKSKKKQILPTAAHAQTTISVGERTKSRRRTTTNAVRPTTPPKSPTKRTKHRTELDFLHEDIQDMFIREGVLTATGKRMCSVLKSENPATPVPNQNNQFVDNTIKPNKRRGKQSLDFKTATENPDNVKLNNVRVVLPKIDLNETKRYSLRNRNVDYDEIDENMSDDNEIRIDDDYEDDMGDVDVEEELDFNKKVTKPTKTVNRKRQKSWAAGILPKSKKSKKSTLSEPKSIDTVTQASEHDKTYYIENVRKKFDCRLCGFVGKFITNHFRQVHPESEVLTSRFSPEKAELAIQDSIDNDYESKDDELVKNALKKFRYQCRFCDFSLHTPPLMFYDHLSIHTGEFRHFCQICQFTCANSKRMNVHYQQKHKNYQKQVEKQIKKKVIYAYMCKECNFVQIDQDRMVKHVHLNHPDQDVKLYKINLSTIPPEGKPRKSKVEGVKKRKKKNRDLELIDEPDVKKIKVDVEEEVDSKVEQVQEYEIEQNEEIPPDIVDDFKDKRIPMNVFTCKTDISEEIQRFEEERLKKMEELNEPVAAKKSLHIADELSNRLLSHIDELEVPIDDKSNVDAVVVATNATTGDEPPIKEEPKIDDDDANKVGEIEVPVTLPVFDKSSCPRVSSDPILVSTKDPTPKQNVMMNDTIEKLRGILVDTIIKDEPIDNADNVESTTQKDSDNTKIDDNFCKKLPKLIPIADNQSGSSDQSNPVHSAGFINIHRNADNIEFVCQIPSCTFVCSDREIFGEHCRVAHDWFNDKHKYSKCLLCDRDITSTDNNLLYEFFQHILTDHADLTATTPQKIGILRMRRLSGDQLSAAKDEAKKSLENNAFQFKIVDVQSLASGKLVAVPPPLAPIDRNDPLAIDDDQSEDPQNLIEVKLGPGESQSKLKSDTAFNAMLMVRGDLFKCPDFNCQCTFKDKDLFDAHVLTHDYDDNRLVGCVYCDVKTPPKQAAAHIVARHAASKFTCSHCLYRCVSRSYAYVHTATKHTNCKNVRIILNKANPWEKDVKPCEKLSPVEVCKPYLCGDEACRGVAFLYENDFEMHLTTQHKDDKSLRCGHDGCTWKFPQAKHLLVHWKRHSIYPFQCLICRFGCLCLTTMLEHYSNIHQDYLPEVVCRIKNPSNEITSYEEAILKVEPISVPILESVNALISALPAKILIATSPKVVAIDKKENVPWLMKVKKVYGKPQLQLANSDDVTATSTSPSTVTAISDDALAAPSIASDDSDYSQDVNPKSYGLVGYQLFRCAFCDESFSNSTNFKVHCLQSGKCRDVNAMKPFKCLHCARLYKNANGLLDHLQYHGQLRYSCSLCARKFPHPIPLKMHMKTQHSVTNTMLTPLVAGRTNPDFDEFILRPRPVGEAEATEKASTIEKTTSPIKLIFAPTEAGELPKRHIFESELKCAICNYSTKVRTNLIRHFTFHENEKSVPAIAPVNPVPCLNKKEKMFDKMTNLAISSITGCGAASEIKSKNPAILDEKIEKMVPAYVPCNRRFVCCAEGCSYICPEESNLRHHLFALHESETSFTCAHCKQILSQTDIDGLIKHLKLHELHLYKCSGCDFVHNLKHKIERHTKDQHSNEDAHVITVRAMDAEIFDVSEPVIPKSELSIDNDQAAQELTSPAQHFEQSEELQTINPKWVWKPWQCNMCKYRCAEQEDMVVHVFNKHNIDAQYKCALCTFQSNELETFEEHFSSEHIDRDVDIIHAYRKNEEQKIDPKMFDTTPLWLRDKPRVRHIRGILFDDSNMASTSTTSSNKSTGSNKRIIKIASSDSIDSAIEAVVKNEIDEDLIAQAQDGLDEESVIIIEDDEGENAADVSMMRNDDDISPYKRRRMPELDTTGADLIFDVAPVDANPKFTNREQFDEKKLQSIYGYFCAPAGRLFKCPICEMFQTKRMVQFVEHLLDEMGYHRFKCNYCHFTNVAYNLTRSHCQIKHRKFTKDSISKLPSNDLLEFWIQLLIKHQCEAMNDLTSAINSLKSRSPSYRYVCKFCSRWFKNTFDMGEHGLIHYAAQAFNCGHCAAEHMTFNGACRHNYTEHHDLEPKLTIDGPNVMDLCGDVTKSGESLINVNKKRVSEESDSIATPSSSEIVQKSTQYGCVACKLTSDDLNVVRMHWNSAHRNESQPTFCYRMVNRRKQQQQPPPLQSPTTPTMPIMTSSSSLLSSVAVFCCTYCHLKGSQDVLRNHHDIEHPLEKFSIYQCICMDCSGTFRSLKEIRAHFLKAHPNKKINYSVIEAPKAGARSQNSYICNKCPFRSASTGGIRTHIRKHLRPITCHTCGANFVYKSEARTHHNKEHAHLPEKIEEMMDKIKEYDAVASQIIGASSTSTQIKRYVNSSALDDPLDDSLAITASTSGGMKRMTARKSTTPQSRAVAPSIDEEISYYSYYGTKSTESDLKKIVTNIEINGIKTIISVEQFSDIFNISPELIVDDCLRDS